MRTVHAVDLVKLGAHVRAFALDRVMALARKRLGWDAQFECAIDGERVRSIHEARLSSGDACSMCRELCAIEVVRDALEWQ
ncbi:MAG: phosphomethylpyrimidine synthase ThiC [Methanosarcinales archaeon]|nr:phosphomethylpyrimidine synthase ThiC [Methanosarcinales archaeon]